MIFPAPLFRTTILPVTSLTAAINALPEPLRRYIHDLETNVDPAGMVRHNIILRAERDQLVAKLAELQGGKERMRLGR